MDVRNGEELDKRDDERPVDGEVGPSDFVREAADERAESTDGVGDDQQVEEELELLVLIGQL
jgi:hypothetical protein